MTRILTICGSLRSGSFNRALARSLPGLCPPDMVIEEAPSFAMLPLYDADDHQSSGIPQQVTDFAAAVRAADGIIIVSPEYNWSIPGGLKNALDWLSRAPDQPFIGKPVLIQSATAGPLGGARMQYHLRMVLTFLDARVFGTPELFVGQAHTKFDPVTFQLTDAPTRMFVTQHLAAFGAFAKATHG